MPKTSHGGFAYKMQQVKSYFLVNVYSLYLSLFKNKENRVNQAFFKLEAFNCKVSFYRLTDNSYRHFTPEIRGKMLLLKLIQRDWPSETFQDC